MLFVTNPFQKHLFEVKNQIRRKLRNAQFFGWWLDDTKKYICEMSFPQMYLNFSKKKKKKNALAVIYFLENGKDTSHYTKMKFSIKDFFSKFD